MSWIDHWSRRRFLAVSGATAAHAATGLNALTQAPTFSQQRTARDASAAMPAPGVITGGVQPLMKGMTARPLRYRPVNGEFVIRNGAEFFNRPVYGPNNDFRVDAGDKPEFSLYLPGHGGNLKLGIVSTDKGESKWAADADEVIARYRPGRMIYEIRDALLGNGTLSAELLTAGAGSGVLLKLQGQGLPARTRIAWGFAGVSGRKGRRNGDIGCEVEPVSRFFQVQPEECDGNRYEVSAERGRRAIARGASKAAEILLTFPVDSVLRVNDFHQWADAPAVAIRVPGGPPVTPEGSSQESDSTIARPMLAGSVELGDAPEYITLEHVMSGAASAIGDPAAAFAERSEQVKNIAAKLSVDTPDEYLNTIGGAISIAADALWDAKQECVMHGGVAWRVALAGWRGAYNLDVLGDHERAKQHIRHWLKRQNVTPVMQSDPATGPWDPNVHLTRKERMLHSNGDVSNNHYDMNMVFMDTLLRHLMWTGDVEFAREVWPALQRHLAWEHRLFRRTFKSAAGEELPLYEAYAAIWASDNLQYNGGGAAHSSAYNVFAFRTAARIARMIGEDGSAYEAEAKLIERGMNELLWIPEQGVFGESKDLFEPRTVYSNPALWTVYHTIDSGVATSRRAWQMAAERLATLKHVPIHGPGVPDGGWYMLSCSDWLPYVWSLNLLLLGENAHMALALWQAGMSEEAYRIFKGALLDSMYMGLCPGDFHMTSALDVHRQEAQRDFGDPIGISSRALMEGLFGIQPDLLAGEVRLRPGFPSDWDRASLRHRDFDFTWHREGTHERYEFTARFSRPVTLVCALPARTTSLPAVLHNGRRVACVFAEDSVGSPVLSVRLAPAQHSTLSLEWHGAAPASAPANRSYRMGERIELPRGVELAHVDDPQGVLSDGKTTTAGFHTVFANVRHGECRWFLPISFTVQATEAAFLPVPRLNSDVRIETVGLSSVLKHNITDVFTRVYAEPRSPYCSLAFADNLLGGWANPDGHASIDDAGLRASGGMLATEMGVKFDTPAGTRPNCIFLSHWRQDQSRVTVPLSGDASGLYVLMAGTSLPQCSRMRHGTVTVSYADGGATKLPLRNPENWWPIEQDYLLDDYLFVNEAPLPPRVDLRTGHTRVLDPVAFHGKGRAVPGGAATILHLPLDATKQLRSLEVEVDLYGVVVALLAATLMRT